MTRPGAADPGAVPPGAQGPGNRGSGGQGPGGRREDRHEEHHRPRTGDEPMHARSPLRMRLTLALIGAVLGVAGIFYYALFFHAEAGEIAFAVFTAVSLVNIAVVARHIRQGPHYQPGRDIPPYRPVDPFPREYPVTAPPTTAVRRRRYLLLMGACFLLICDAWTWVRLLSVPAAIAMSAVAALIPPFASVLTNAGSPILRDPPDPDPSEGPGGFGAGNPGGPGDGAGPGAPSAPGGQNPPMR